MLTVATDGNLFDNKLRNVAKRLLTMSGSECVGPGKNSSDTHIQQGYGRFRLPESLIESNQLNFVSFFFQAVFTHSNRITSNMHNYIITDNPIVSPTSVHKRQTENTLQPKSKPNPFYRFSRIHFHKSKIVVCAIARFAKQIRFREVHIVNAKRTKIMKIMKHFAPEKLFLPNLFWCSTLRAG